MVKKSKKSKSKRITLRQKYKVIKKVKEHHRKKAKEAKKLGLHRKQKVQKDPGIPNDWPFKEQELKALEARRTRALEEIEQKKAARKERAKQMKEGLLDDITTKEKKSVTYVRQGIDSTISGKRLDSSERVFYKEMVKVIDASDVVLEVLDARDPLGTRCVDIENMVVKHGSYKHLVLLLNKIDLVPKESVEKWLNYLREELPAIAFKCNTQEQRSNLGWRRSSKPSKPSKPGNIWQTSDCLGAETLLKLLKNYSRSHEIKKSITVGVIGLPNVGKSSLINSLKRCRAVNVGATPGLTRSMQEVHLDNNVRLLDCPGVVMLGSNGDHASMALRNCKRVEKMDDVVGPVKEILKICPEKTLVLLYKIPTFVSVDDFLQKMAVARGKLKKGGALDLEGAARIIIRDWNEGKIPYHTMPPTRNPQEHSEAKVVYEFSKEFDIDEVYGSESSFIGSLKSLDDFYNLEITPSSPFRAAEIEEETSEGEKQVQMLESIRESEEEEEEEEEEEMGVDGGEDDDDELMTDNKVEVKGKSEKGKENEELYAVEGILKPGRVRAEKKRRKKAHRLMLAEMAKADTSNMDSEYYDFRVDYSK